MGADEWTEHSTYRGFTIEEYTETELGRTSYRVYLDQWRSSTLLPTVYGYINDYIDPSTRICKWEHRGIDICYGPYADMYYYTVYEDEHFQPTLEQARVHIDTLLEEPEPPPPGESPCPNPENIWPWYKGRPYYATPIWKETYKAWNIWHLAELGAMYGITKPDCVAYSQTQFRSSITAARTWINGLAEIQEPFTTIIDFVVPYSLPEDSDVNVSVLLKNTGGASGYLSCVIDGNPNAPDDDRTVETGSTSPTSVAPGDSIWLDIYFRYYKMPKWNFNLTATNFDRTSQISKTITLAAPEIVDGHILVVYYWVEGMVSWEDLTAYPYPAKVGDDIHLAVVWVNDGFSAVVGHVDAQLTSPRLYSYLPDAVLNQDRSANPGSGYGVQFAPVSLNESGSWEFYGRLTLDGTIVDFKKFTFAVEEVAVGIPTTTTINIPDKTIAGEKFTVYGVLYETEAVTLIPGQRINISYNGKSLGFGYTDSEGNYSIDVSINEGGVWTIKAEFPGTETLRASNSEAEATVAASPLKTVIKIAVPAAIVIALTIYILN